MLRGQLAGKIVVLHQVDHRFAERLHRAAQPAPAERRNRPGKALADLLQRAQFSRVFVRVLCAHVLRVLLDRPFPQPALQPALHRVKLQPIGLPGGNARVPALERAQHIVHAVIPRRARQRRQQIPRRGMLRRRDPAIDIRAQTPPAQRHLQPLAVEVDMGAEHRHVPAAQPLGADLFKQIARRALGFHIGVLRIDQMHVFRLLRPWLRLSGKELARQVVQLRVRKLPVGQRLKFACHAALPAHLFQRLCGKAHRVVQRRVGRVRRAQVKGRINLAAHAAQRRQQPQRRARQHVEPVRKHIGVLQLPALPAKLRAAAERVLAVLILSRDAPVVFLIDRRQVV